MNHIPDRSIPILFYKTDMNLTPPATFKLAKPLSDKAWRGFTSGSFNLDALLAF